MRRSCWRARLALQQLFPIQNLLQFPIFNPLPNFIFECYRPQTWQFYLFFPALFISGIHKVPGWIGHVTRSCKGPIPFRTFPSLSPSSLFLAYRSYREIRKTALVCHPLLFSYLLLSSQFTSHHPNHLLQLEVSFLPIDCYSFPFILLY